MNHKMKLWPDSFNKIKYGIKTIEIRLNDEKRLRIKKGDFIEFSESETNEKLLCKVHDIHHYNTFDELYLNHNKLSIGYGEDEVANPEDMLAYYSHEDIRRYGVVGLRVQIIKN